MAIHPEKNVAIREAGKRQDQRSKVEQNVPFLQKLAYGIGNIPDGIGANSVKNLANPIFNITLGVSPALIGLAVAIQRIWDAFTDPFMGRLSDNFRSRFGRRRPFIALGAILMGLFFMVILMVPRDMSPTFYFWYFLISSLCFYTAFTIFSVPLTGLGYEMSPDYHERTKIMAFGAFFGPISTIFIQWIYPFTQLSLFKDTIQGAHTAGIVIGVLLIVLGLVPALFIKERYLSESLKQNPYPLLVGLKEAFQVKPFVFLMGVTTGLLSGVMVVAHLGFYLIIYYVHGGDTKAGSIGYGWYGTVKTVAAFASIPVIAEISIRIGKKNTMLVSILIILFVRVADWWLYNPMYPWLIYVSAFITAIGWGGFYMITSSMVADICDLDELKSGSRREALFGAVFSWIKKFGVSVSIMLSGFVLVLCGFNSTLGPDQTEDTILKMRLLYTGVSVVVLLISVILIGRYSVTEEDIKKARKILGH